MIILLAIGILLVGVTVFAFAFAFGPRTEPTADGLAHIPRYGYEGRSEDGKEATGVRGRLDSLAAKLGAAASGRSRGTNLNELRAHLNSAGMYDVSPGKFLGYRVLCTIGVPILWVWFAVTVGTSSALTVIGTIIALAGGWWLPLQFVKDRGARRLQEIDYQLPELIDLLVVTVEAGLGFVGSMQMASERTTGALGEELRLTLQQQRFGLSVNEALMGMLDRVDTPSTRSFVRSIVQGETLGVSIGQIMRDLALEMRRRRRQSAQERAQKAPIKILFPLVFLIFPAMFVILLGPALFLFLRSFGG
jgi:tight adherence protein C